MYQPIHDAHGELVRAVAEATKPGWTPIPITLVSVSPGPEGQMVIFDGNKFTKGEVAARLREAAAFVAKQPS